MTIREWLARCADRFMSRGGMTRQQAETAATACFEANADGADGFDPLADYDPEAAADEEMSYWGD